MGKWIETADAAMVFYCNGPLIITLLILSGFQMLRCRPAGKIYKEIALCMTGPVLDSPSFLTPSQTRASRPGGV